MRKVLRKKKKPLVDDDLGQELSSFSDEELSDLSVLPVHEVFETAINDQLKRPQWQYVWEWADRSCWLTSRTSNEVGRYSSLRTPYIREPLEALSPRVRDENGNWKTSEIETVVLMKGAQLGGTLGLLYWLGYNIDVEPGPFLVVFPTLELARKWSKVKLQEVLTMVPKLNRIVTNAKEKEFGNEVLAKYFPGGFLAMVGANSPAGFRQLTIRNAACDDFDGFPASAGDEGSPAELVANRQTTFSDAKTYLVSTPTIKGASNIEHAYALTDQRKFFVPCIHCGHMQVIEWKNIHWPSGKPEKAKMTCIECGKQMENRDKNVMLPRGEWRPTNPTPRMRTWRGYHLPGLYAPHGWKASWPNQARRWVAAQGDREALQVFINTVLAETFEDAQVKKEVGVDYLMARREPYSTDIMPEGVLVLVGSIDVQGDRLEVAVQGYGLDRECWHIEHYVLEGSPTFVDLSPESGSVWRAAFEILSRPRKHEKYGEIAILASCVDTGGACTQSVYDAVKRVQTMGVVWWAVKGKSGTDAIWPRHRSTAKIKRTLLEVPLYLICVDSAKAQIYDSVALEEAGPNFRHFPMTCDEIFFDQLMAERRIREYSKGVAIDKWVLPQGKRNEILDLSVYCLAALCGLESQGLDLVQRRHVLESRRGVPLGYTAARKRRTGSSGIEL